MGLISEMIRYGVLRGGTNKFYGGSGTTRVTVNGKVTLNLLRKIKRNLELNHSMKITSVLAPSAAFNTSPIEAAYVVVGGTDLEADIRDLPGFTPVAEYGSRKPISPQELGSCEGFRFVLSPELAPYADAATSTTASAYGLLSTTGTNPDVYPMLVMGEEAFGQVALRFNGSDVPVDPTFIAVGTKSAADPLGQRGYAGGKFWMTAVLLNQGWMAVAEVGASAL